MVIDFTHTKEIGIRKVHGALDMDILIMLNMDFVKLVLISFLFSIPLAYYAMNIWLDNFAYKVSIEWWIFVASGMIGLLITLMTVSVNSFFTTIRNPVNALRYE